MKSYDASLAKIDAQIDRDLGGAAEVVPIRRGGGSWPAMAPEAYHGVAGDFVRTVEPNTEADPAAMLVQFLTFYGAVIGRSARYRVEATDHYANLFAVLVGQSAKGRKDTSRKHVEAVYRDLDETFSTRIVEGLSSGEGLIWNVRDPIEKPERDRKTGTVEYVIAVEGIADKRLLVTESEFAGALKSVERHGNTLSPIIRRAWDSGDLAVLTKNSPARATCAHISILGNIVGDELRRLLGSTEVANGFGNRFLWIAARRSKLLPNGGDGINLEPIRARLRRALDFGRQPRVLVRDADAARLWERAYPKLTADTPGIAGSLTSRSEAQAVRLSLVYALLDGSPKIRVDHLAAALAVLDYNLSSVRLIFGHVTGNRDADLVVAALRERGALTATEVSDLFGRNRPQAQLAAVLGDLLDQGLVVEERAAGLRGRPTRTYRIAEGVAA